MELRRLVGFADDVVIGEGTLRSSVGITRFSDAALATALHQGATFAALTAQGTTIRGRTVAEVLAVLHTRRMLTWRLIDGDGTQQLTASPRRQGVPWPDLGRTQTPAGTRLSRFALLRPMDPAGWLLESGASDWEVRLTPAAATEITAGDAGLLGVLGVFGMLDSDDENPALTTWEFHDRYFASRSRLDLGGGGTFRFAGRVPPVPALEHPAGVGAAVQLPAPSTTPPADFWEVTERRRTVRTFAADPLPLADLADLLWRTVRIREVGARIETDPRSYESTFKPVPSAGATHAVNIWLVSSNVAGLPDGAWWYDGVAHALHRTAGTAPLSHRPYGAPAMILLTSRHARLAWKYEAMAYSLALKDVGVLMHALQLAGTAMRLAVVPLGSGPVTAVVETLGIDPLVHTPVGEVAIGAPAPE